MRNIFKLAVFAAVSSIIVATSASGFAADAMPSPEQANSAPAAQGAMPCHPKGQKSKPGSASEAPVELQRAPAGSLRQRIKQVPRPARQMTEVQPV